MYKEERIDMKAIVYASVHHGNTKKVVEAIAKRKNAVAFVKGLESEEKKNYGKVSMGVV
jgi:flavodoxin